MSTETLTKSTLRELSAIAEGSAAAAAIDGRSNIMSLSQTTEDAVLKPQETGAWSHDVRAALAARIAALNGETALADRYCALIEDARVADVADPLRSGKAQGLEKICDFMDKVAVQTRDIDAQDINALQDAGISDADIVRLCEINAFMAYQVRVLAGIRLMTEGRT
ncbi:hypothetical protein [Labrenzia sp. OB1]|uniref:hypothetical protein n=1 Tax=Labrenzia sp. OB1 TaxID=1561204 RepID=UPI0007B28878|nr:hypothetical protein [Labrenzia sp. OB1]KZM50636.1 hypothetical protein OA90_09475 [Labrenzia sp. OB1]